MEFCTAYACRHMLHVRTILVSSWRDPVSRGGQLGSVAMSRNPYVTPTPRRPLAPAPVLPSTMAFFADCCFGRKRPLPLLLGRLLRLCLLWMPCEDVCWSLKLACGFPCTWVGSEVQAVACTLTHTYLCMYHGRLLGRVLFA